MGPMEREEPAAKEDDAPVFKQRAEPKPFASSQWKPDAPIQRQQMQQGSMAPPMPPPMSQQISPPMSPVNLTPPTNDFGMQLPPMQPTAPDLDFPEEPFPLDEDDTQKKKGLFGMFKK